MAKKFKRHYTGSQYDNGKGSWQRGSQVSDKEVSDNWCAAFGHRPDHSDGTTCITCGESLPGKGE